MLWAGFKVKSTENHESVKESPHEGLTKLMYKPNVLSYLEAEHWLGSVWLKLDLL